MDSSPEPLIPALPPPAAVRRLAVMVLLVALAACTNGGGLSSSRPGASDADATSAPVDGAAGGSGATQGDAGDETEGSTGTGEPVEISDPKSRRTASGKVPGYVEIASASVSEARDEIVFSVRLAGEVPDSTPRGESFRVAFQVITADDQRANLGAQTGPDGWTTFATNASGEELGAELTIDGNEVRIAVNPTDIAPLPIRWIASVGWTKGSSYGFDTAPEQGYASFPQ